MMTKKQCAIGYTKTKLAGHEILYADGIAQCVNGAVQNEPLPTEERSSAQTLVEAVLDYLEHQEQIIWTRWPSGKVSAFVPEGFQARNPTLMKIRRLWGLLHTKSYIVTKRSSAGVAWKLGEGVSSTSSDSGSKLRGPSQNSPHVASNRDVNKTKPISNKLR
ncbi:hypothetical protein AVEN_11214-1 [Araneus ventricosus]|uniref:Uncharacterized protein n=1 Tax=Araneus ventricosus TaxID=182803 RepID=A0A4Y2QEP4_ARAVE|nr:hypothetical protein AVEN_11214-1 [Araneus ventricosus]